MPTSQTDPWWQISVVMKDQEQGPPEDSAQHWERSSINVNAQGRRCLTRAAIRARGPKAADLLGEILPNQDLQTHWNIFYIIPSHFQEIYDFWPCKKMPGSLWAKTAWSDVLLLMPKMQDWISNRGGLKSAHRRANNKASVLNLRWTTSRTTKNN